MIKQLKILLLVSLCFMLILPLSAQNFRGDLVKMTNKYEQSSFKMNVKMEVVHRDGTPSILKRGVVKRKGLNYYTEFDKQVSLKNSDYMIIVSEIDKQIIYSKINSKAVKSKIDNIIPDSSFFQTDAKLIKNTSAGKTYEVSQPQYGISKMRIEIASNNTLRRVIYYYTDNEDSPVKEVRLTYENVVFNPSFSSNEFSEKKYLNFSAKKIMPTTAYRDYVLTNATAYQ